MIRSAKTPLSLASHAPGVHTLTLAAKRARMMPAAGAFAHRRLLSSLSAGFGVAAAFTGLHVMRSRGGFTAAPLCDDHGSADDGGSAHHRRWSAPTFLLASKLRQAPGH